MSRILSIGQAGGRRVVRQPVMQGPRPVTDNPEVFYHILVGDPDLAGLNNVAFFTVYPDAAKIVGNFEVPYFNRDMKLQGIKLQVYPRITDEYGIIGPPNYPTGLMGYCLQVLGNSSVELKINDAPIFTWKLSELMPDVKASAVVQGLETTFSFFVREGKFTIFKDLGATKKLDVEARDRVSVEMIMAAAIDAREMPADFAVGCFLLTRPLRKLFV